MKTTRFKLLINLHRDRDDGGGKEGTREGTGKLRRGRSSAAPAAAEGVVDHLHKEYAPRFLDFPAVFRAVAHMQRAYLGKVGCRLSMRVQKGWVSHGQPNFD